MKSALNLAKESFDLNEVPVGAIVVKDNKIIGKVTSAVYSPRLKKNIALAMVEIQQSKNGNKFDVISNEGKFNCTVVEKPFYDPKKKIANS